MNVSWLVLLLGSIALAQSPTLTPAPLSLVFTYQLGTEKLPAAQALAVKISAGTPNYTIAIGGNNTEWLTVTPETGKMPASLSARVNPSGLVTGKYQATVSITVAGVSSAATVPVTLSVTEPPPTLVPSLLSLAFAWPPNPTPSQSIRFVTTGGPIAFTAVATGATWMTVTPSSGLALPGSPAQIQVAVDSSGLAPADKPYVGKITITTSGNTATKTLTLNVTFAVSPLRPEITSLWPAALKTGSPSTTITVRGSNFYGATLIRAEGVVTPLKVTLVSSTVIWAVIPESLLTTDSTLRLTASNPAPGGDSAPGAVTVASGAVVQAIANTASNATGVGSPGMIVSLYGEGIGPAGIENMKDSDGDGFADLRLAGVTVTIGGVGAPILSLSEDRIGVQIPYEVPIADIVPIQVLNGSVTASGTIRIVATSPGLFTSDGSGIGQAAAFNYISGTNTYVLNGQSTPAKPGDTVVLYATGEGDYATSIIRRTGFLVRDTGSPLPQISPLPDVMIGGKKATVNFAGPIIGAVLGIVRIDAVVPEGGLVGNAVPVVVSIGSGTSQAGVTVAVKK